MRVTWLAMQLLILSRFSISDDKNPPGTSEECDQCKMTLNKVLEFVIHFEHKLPQLRGEICEHNGSDVVQGPLSFCRIIAEQLWQLYFGTLQSLVNSGNVAATIFQETCANCSELSSVASQDSKKSNLNFDNVATPSEDAENLSLPSDLGFESSDMSDFSIDNASANQFEVFEQKRTCQLTRDRHQLMKCYCNDWVQLMQRKMKASFRKPWIICKVLFDCKLVKPAWYKCLFSRCQNEEYSSQECESCAKIGSFLEPKHTRRYLDVITGPQICDPDFKNISVASNANNAGTSVLFRILINFAFYIRCKSVL